MPPKRLSNPEKQSILQLYRHPEETTSTLASRFGVSSSTISRVLKQGLSSDEYEALVQQKRTGVPRPLPAAAPDSAAESSSEGVAASRRILADVAVGVAPQPAQPQPDIPASRPSAEQQAASDRPSDGPDAADASASPASAEEAPLPSASSDRPGPILRKRSRVVDTDDALDDDSDEDGDSAEDLDFQDDDDDDDDFTDLDDDDDDSDEDGDGDSDDDFASLHVRGSDSLEVRPLAEARLPRTCYLVIDRAAELITRPLRDFADLGHIPSGEVEEKTLPIFDNHRVAKRFSNRRVHRIVKIPDSRLLQKTTAYLQAKGITRLLFDGQVYDLSSQDN